MGVTRDKLALRFIMLIACLFQVVLASSVALGGVTRDKLALSPTNPRVYFAAAVVSTAIGVILYFTSK